MTDNSEFLATLQNSDTPVDEALAFLVGFVQGQGQRIDGLVKRIEELEDQVVALDPGWRPTSWRVEP